MHLRSFATRLLVALSILVAVAFAGDSDSFSFYLSSNRIYAPNDPETSIEFNGNDVGRATVLLRAFKVDDPVEFFLSQKDPHSPTLQKPAQANTFDMLRLGYRKVTRDARYAAQDIMPTEARQLIRDVADINGVKAASGDRKEADSAAIRAALARAEQEIPPGAEKYRVVKEWSQQLAARDTSNNDGEENDGWNYQSIQVPIHEKGVYLIEARVRGRRAITALIISEYGMVIKQVKNEAMAYVANRKSGEKVAGMPLTFARGGEKLAEQEAGSDGVAHVNLPAPPERKSEDDDEEDDSWRWDYRDHQVLILGEKDGNFVISDPYYYSYGDNDSYKVYLHTDRPIYRPSQTVYYRGIVRRVKDDGTYEVNAGDTAYIEITDSRDGAVRKDTVRLSDMGTFSGELTLGDEPPLGNYSIRVFVGKSENYFSFEVDEYKKPEYKVVVTTDRTEYTRGDQITATVKADYFFGSPVANAQVEYFVYRARYWRPWWRNSEWAYLYEDGEGEEFATYRQEMVNSGTGTLNPDGTFTITYRTEDSADQDYVYRIQANVVDNSRRSISGAKSVEVTRGEFYISARTDKYVYKPGEEAHIITEIATFAGDKPVATPFNVKVKRIWWDRKMNPDSSYTYDEHQEDVWTGAGATDAAGRGTVVFKPQKAGYFQAEISANDKRGTPITETAYIYVADDAYADWYREGSSDVQIIPDKEAYAPGETMSALVIMPAAKIDALVSVEGGTIYHYQVERLNATSAVIHLPIEERYAPMVFISASAIVNDQMYTESKRVTVVPQGKSLKLEIKANKDIYKPAEKGTVTVRAVDEKGEPVPNVDVAVGMVDEAIYSIQPDYTPDIQRSFYGSRWNEVSTSSSLSFSFSNSSHAIGDEGLLYGDLLGKGNELHYSRLADAGRRNLAFGDIKGEMFVQPTVRKNFKDMMFWTPSARTGSDGIATLQVEFPDNLTTWRITARGVTKETAVGQAVGRVIARKDLMVRMETPRFLTQGDELLIATTVHNYLGSAKTTKVEFSGQNVSLSDRERIVNIPANGEQRIDWRVKTQQIGTATLTVKALTNEESDAMELPVPVIPRGMKLTTSGIADIDEKNGSRTISLNLPENSDPASSDLYLTVSPSLASSLLGSLDGLIGYPYGCVEQTMSRFLPTVVVAQTLKQLDLPFPDDKRQAIPKMVGKGFTKLYGMQHEDGGWGWWVNDETDAFMTAYVMYGMTIAKAAGYEVIDERYQNGLNSLREQLTSRTSADGRLTEPTTEAYMLYVLAMIDRGNAEPVLEERLPAMARIDTLNSYAKSLLALACNYQGYKQLATSLAGALQREATTSQPFTFWKGKSWHYEWEDDAIETSAYAVNALFTIKGESDQVRGGIRWLLSQKEGDTWHNTRQTAMVIYSLADYLKNTKELSPNYAVTVRVNGQPVYNRKITKADVFAPEQKVRIDRAALHTGANNVTVEKSGDGSVYSSARLVYYATGAALQPQSAGFKVTREYFTLRKQRQGDVYVYAKSPYTGTVKTGDEIFVKVKVVPDAPYEYIMLEDPLPAGCEVVKNTDGYTIPGEPEYDEKARQERGYYGWYWWYADRDVRDEKVAFFARYIWKQSYEFTYVMRAQIPGSYTVMPSVGSLMYYPEVRGNSASLAMNITE